MTKSQKSAKALATKLSASANKAWATRRKSGNPSESAKVAWESRRMFAEALAPKGKRSKAA